MTQRIFPILATLLVASPLLAQDTVFSTGFEYESEDIIIEPADLNGADDQVGEWSGDEFPENSGGDILEFPDSVGFADNPLDGGRLLLVDRPGANFDGENFQGSFFAELTDPILLLGATVQFDVATRRTGGNNNKDYDIIGRDSNGDESFHIRVGTNNNGGERLGIVTDDGANVLFDLPTIAGDDQPADLDNTGGFPLGVNDEIATVTLSLGATGYTIDFAHDEQNTSAQANAYTTELISYNGPGVDLAQVEFTYSANSATGSNSGYVLDNVLVTGFEELLQGDFDLNGSLEFADFLILAANFGENTSDGDFDFSGTVDLADFVGFKAAFNATGQATAAAVPEPSGLALIACAAVFGLCGRRRRR